MKDDSNYINIYSNKSFSFIEAIPTATRKKELNANRL